MLTEQYIKGQSFPDQSQAILDETARLLLREQSQILYTYYNTRTGRLGKHLTGNHFHIAKSTDGIKMVLDYLPQIRFMDMKKTASGVKKKIYHPIYNKPLYGYLLGYAYNKLRLGLSTYLRRQTVRKIEQKIQFEIPLS